jgi:hypothetical protein
MSSGPKKRNELAFEEAGKRHPGGAHGGSGNWGELCRWPESWVREILSFNQYKKYDFVFIGRIHSGRRCRSWIYDFIEKHFTSNSFLYFTDADIENIPHGFKDKPYYKSEYRELFLHKVQRPRGLGLYNLDAAYWQVMCQSQFVLCPGGHLPWSMRFFEAGLAKALPIIRHEGEKGCAKAFKFYRAAQFKDTLLAAEPALIRHNFEAFLKQFTFFSKMQVQQLMNDYDNLPSADGAWNKLVKKYDY